jgi:hypothetical protein
MEEPYIEGVATRDGPESCVGFREGVVIDDAGANTWNEAGIGQSYLHSDPAWKANWPSC